jgi:hypothetical protein
MISFASPKDAKTGGRELNKINAPASAVYSKPIFPFAVKRGIGQCREFQRLNMLSFSQSP